MSMRSMRFFRGAVFAPALGGVLALSGCGDSEPAKGPDMTQDRAAAEASARQKAYGTTGNPVGTKGAVNAEAEARRKAMGGK
jgi:hypothetical protein